MNSDTRATVICADAHASRGFQTFNPNEWSGESKGVVQSCATEIGVHFYTADRIASMCSSAESHCQSQFNQLNDQWRLHPWDLARGRYFAQVPDLHVLVQGFFAGIKSILDLLAQLLTSEGVVRVKVDGFHRKGAIYGGAVLRVLERNSVKEREPLATVIRSLLLREKELWIDQAIQARDLLVHPRRGAQQLMFELELENVDGDLSWRGTHPPHVDGETIDRFAKDRIEKARDFAAAFLAALRPAG